MRKTFLSNSLRCIEDELKEINVRNFYIDFGEVLPDEEVIGEFDNFEKRVFIWHVLMANEIQKVREENRKAKFLDKEEVDQFLLEIKIYQNKSAEITKRATESLRQRLGGKGKPLLFRGNFKIVTSNRSLADIKADNQKINKFIRDLVWHGSDEISSFRYN